MMIIRALKMPDFAYGAALAKTIGHAVLRMADAEVLPFDFRNLAQTIERYAKEVTEMTNTLRDVTSTDNQLIKSKSYALAADPTKHLATPKEKAEVPAIDFSALTTAVEALKVSAAKLAESSGKADKTIDRKALNEKLYQAEQQLLAADGLPRSDWYKHAIYAPGFYTGYGVKTLPGIREAIEQRNFTEAQQQIGVVAKSILQLAAYLDQ
jgi:N-acetylated-alpha-linked acidic dipeptidase